MRLAERKELLEEFAYEYLHALLHSNPICRDENSAVYINQGRIESACRIFNLTFDVTLRRKVTFYKANGKEWFSVVNEAFSEEEAEERRKNHLLEWHESSVKLWNL